MKKLIALIITLSMVCSLAICQSVYADVDSTLAYDLNIVSADTPDSMTTRGDFASMIAKILYMDSAINNANNVYTFYDVPEEHPSYADIEFLANAGIIAGNGSGYFYPDRAITVSEASKMMILALRYDLMVTDGNYQAVASSRKLFNGVEFKDGGFTHENAAVIIANMLGAPYDEFEGINGDLTFNGETYMQRVLGVYEYTGVVTDDGLTSLTGDTGVEEGFIKVDDKVFSYSQNKDGLIGRKVVVYYKDNAHSTKWDDAVSVKALSNSDVVTLDASVITDFKDFTYNTEDENGKKKDYKVSKTAAIRYNGRILRFDKSVTTEEFNELMHAKTGSVTLVNTNSGAYDFVDVVSYKSMVVGSVFATEKDKEYVIYSLTDKSEYITVDYEETDYVITNTEGKEIYLDMIKKDDIISYAVSHNGEWARIIVCNDMFSKGIDEVNDDGVVIGGVEYRFAPECNMDISIGNIGTVYLNFLGEIVYVSQGGGEGLLALFGGYDETSGFSGKLKVQVFTEEANLIELVIDKSVIIDGQKKTSAQAKEFFNKKDVFLKVVNVVYDKNKVLKKLDTPYSDCDTSIAYDADNESRDTLHYIKNIKEKPVSSIPFNYYSSTFGGEIIVDGGTVVFAIPDDATNLEDAFIASITEKYFIDGMSYYTISAFSNTENSVYADAIVMKGMDRKFDFTKHSYNSNTNFGVVTRIANTTNAMGEPAQRIYIENGKNVVQYTTEDMDTLKCSKWSSNLCDIEVGDIVKYMVPTDGILYTKSIMSMLDASEDKIVCYGSLLGSNTWSIRAYKMLGVAYCVNIMDGLVEYSITPPDGEIDYNNTKTYVFRMAYTPIFVFDRATGELMNGNINDMITAVVDPDNATKFYYMHDVGRSEMIVIYK